MQSPLEFLDAFRGDLRAAGLRFAITSGMACVRYGLQQTTKDSDWILPPDQADPLRAVFAHRESALPAWTIRYRSIFGAPLEAEWLAGGWTSHLAIRTEAGGAPPAGGGTLAAGLARAAVLANIEPARLAALAPPIEEMLP